jgi:hypothetical protein
MFVKEYIPTIANCVSAILSSYAIFNRNKDPDLQADLLNRVYGVLSILLLIIGIVYSDNPKVQVYIIVISTIISFYTISFFHKKKNREFDRNLEIANMIGTLLFYKITN